MNQIPQLVDASLYNKIVEIEDVTLSDVVAINGPINDELLEFIIDLIEKKGKKKRTLTVLLTTNGGSAEVAERIVFVFRRHYQEVNFYIPDHAYSAGTILSMSGDEIFMDYHSVLGPIDPQVQNREGKFVPALGYLDKIQELISLARKGLISEAEFLILKDFDLAELKAYEQARDLTIDLLKEWLVKYKFKNWTERETSHTPVSEQDRINRAEEIAMKLSNNNKWHSHGRPLNIEKLKEIGLQIIDLEVFNKQLHTAIRDFHNLMLEQMKATNTFAQVLTREVLQ